MRTLRRQRSRHWSSLCPPGRSSSCFHPLGCTFPPHKTDTQYYLAWALCHRRTGCKTRQHTPRPVRRCSFHIQCSGRTCSDTGCTTRRLARSLSCRTLRSRPGCCNPPRRSQKPSRLHRWHWVAFASPAQRMLRCLPSYRRTCDWHPRPRRPRSSLHPPVGRIHLPPSK